MTGRTLLLTTLLMAWPAALPLQAQIGPDNVLLIVNTDSSASTAIRDAYQAKYPAVHVWSYAGSTAVTITRDTYNTQIRSPLDTYLRTTSSGGQLLYQKVRVLVTTKGVPRRIWDIDGTSIGDNADQALSQFNNLKYDAAAVDSELVLVHQDLSAGSSPAPANYANNYIHSPYHTAASRIHTYSRTYAANTKDFTFNQEGGWESVTSPLRSALTPGDIYLVARLEGYTVADVTAALNRAGTIPLDRIGSTVVIDRDATHAYDDGGGELYDQGPDFPDTRDMLLANGFNALYDATGLFLTTAPKPLVGYCGYGVNHFDANNSRNAPGGALYVLNGLQFTLARGAIFNTYESWNGRNFESANPYDPAQHDPNQGQVADWLRIGGTFGLGQVFEPLAFSIPDNEILYERLFVRGWTFAEAAYASLPVISWQNIVVGDPLATFQKMSEVTGWRIVADHGAPAQQIATTVADGYVEPRLQGIRTLEATFSRQVNPATVLPGAVSIVGTLSGNQSALIQSLQLDGTQLKLTIRLSAALPDADRYTVTINPTLLGTDGQPFAGYKTLSIGALAGDADGSGRVGPGDILALRQYAGQTLGSANARYDLNGSGTATGADLLAARARLGHALP